jgi:hypothetical protein
VVARLLEFARVALELRVKMFAAVPWLFPCRELPVQARIEKGGFVPVGLRSGVLIYGKR